MAIDLLDAGIGDVPPNNAFEWLFAASARAEARPPAAQRER